MASTPFPSKSFPEPVHTKHKPSGEADKAHFTKSSKHVGAGHTDNTDRLPDPNAEWINEESGRGLGNPTE